MLVTVSYIKKGLGLRWLSFRYDLSSDEGWSSSPWIELGDWTRFLYNNYDFYEGNKVHWEHFYRRDRFVVIRFWLMCLRLKWMRFKRTNF